ncbi:MAG TPA: hypothetical protein VF162_16285 [Streptosporangiaceae bacterium]
MRRLAIGLVAAAAVIAPLLTSAAASASPAAARPKIFSAEQAGAAIGAPRVQYRYVETTFTLPKSSKLPYTSGGGISVQLRSDDDVFVLGISATPGSQWNAAAVDLQPGSCTSAGCIFYSNGNSPVMNAGDSVTLSVFRNYDNGFVYYTAKDNTSGAVFSSRFADPGAAFSSVRVGAEFAVFPAGTPGSAFTAPAQDFRLVLLSGTKVTQKNGTKVSLVSSSQVIETSNGTKTGTVQVNAPTVYNNGQNTGIWVRH